MPADRLREQEVSFRPALDAIVEGFLGKAEKVALVRDRRAITLGTLFNARSIGMVTCCSISSAAWPGMVVITTTWVSEMSG